VRFAILEIGEYRSISLTGVNYASNGD